MMRRPLSSSIRFLLLLALAAAVVVLLIQVAAPAPVARGKAAPVLLDEGLDADRQAAQELALRDRRVLDRTVGERSEVMGILPAGAQLSPASQGCTPGACYQVNIYNIDADLNVAAMVDVAAGRVLDVLYQPGVRPGINKRLADRALEIAFNAPEVIEVLGYRPVAADWPPMDADLAGSECDGSQFCVAPTFHLGNYIVWAFVNLTTEEFVKLAWTPSQPYDPALSTEILYGGCPAPGTVSRDGWELSFETTPSDGMRVYDVRFNGRDILRNAKIAEWHVHYTSGSGFVDAPGCGGGAGFPIYPTGETKVFDIEEDGQTVGFSVQQDFRMSNWGNSCNYRYENHYEFYLDGRFRVRGGAFGKGCGTTGTYRPLIVMDMAIDGVGGESVAQWDGADWTPLTTEAVFPDPNAISPDGYSFRISDGTTANGFYLEPGRGQFGEGEEEGDAEFFYPVLYHAAEVDPDLGSIGPCCSPPNHGPESRVNGEAIDDAHVVLWYVSSMVTDASPPEYYCWTVSGEPNPETYPCWSGPMFVPMALQSAPSGGFTHDGPAAVGEPVRFTAAVEGTEPITLTWDFGDGSGTTGPDPQHSYGATGTYTVVMTATNPYGEITAQGTVEIVAAPAAGFSHDGPVTLGNAAHFTNLSAGEGTLSYLWSFGDGSESTAVNPSHVYQAAGSYEVTLTATNKAGSNTATQSIVVAIPPQISSMTVSGNRGVGMPINFSLLLAGSPPFDYLWEFGDGSTSTDAAPTHAYGASGEYTVSVQVQNAVGSATLTRVVAVGALPFVAFVPPTAPEAGAPIVFQNNSSSAEPMTFLWEFGDGSTSTEENPTHTYTRGGIFTVTLTATNQFGSTSSSQTVIVTGTHWLPLVIN